MEKEVRVEIGGIGFLFRYKDCQIKEEGRTLNIKDFIWPGKNDFVIDIELGKLPEYSRKRMLFQAKENWRCYIYKRNYIFETYESQENESMLKITRVCNIDKYWSTAKVYISPKINTANNGRTWSLEQLMRILGQLITVSILHRFQGLLIHSSGVILNGEGIIFAGISGAGKTTLTKLWQKRSNATVLSDDRVIVRKEKEKYFVYGTPWPGEGKAVSSQKVPLRKIFFLSKAHRNKLATIEKQEGLHQLIIQSFPAIWDKESVDFSLRFCGELIENIPCCSFGFVPEQSAVEFILKNR